MLKNSVPRKQGSKKTKLLYNEFWISSVTDGKKKEQLYVIKII